MLHCNLFLNIRSQESVRASAALAISVLVHSDNNVRLKIAEKGVLKLLVAAMSSSDAKTKKHAGNCFLCNFDSHSIEPFNLNFFCEQL